MNQFFYVKTPFDIYVLSILTTKKARWGEESAATDKAFPQHLR